MKKELEIPPNDLPKPENSPPVFFGTLEQEIEEYLKNWKPTCL